MDGRTDTEPLHRRSPHTTRRQIQVQQAAAVLTAKRRIAAATYRTRLTLHTRTLQKAGRCTPKIAPFPRSISAVTIEGDSVELEASSHEPASAARPLKLAWRHPHPPLRRRLL